MLSLLFPQFMCNRLVDVAQVWAVGVQGGGLHHQGEVPVHREEQVQQLAGLQQRLLE